MESLMFKLTISLFQHSNLPLFHYFNSKNAKTRFNYPRGLLTKPDTKDIYNQKVKYNEMNNAKLFAPVLSKCDNRHIPSILTNLKIFSMPTPVSK